VRFVSYPPQGYGPQGYQPYGSPPPGYGPYGPGPAGPPSPALAYITAIVFIVCGALSLMLAIVGWNGTSDNGTMMAALIGAAFTEDLTGNVDFAISVTMSVACTVLLFGLVQFSRLEFVRWILAVVGALVTVYYLYAIIWILSNDAGDYIAMALVAWLLWLFATVLAVLPATGRANRKRIPAGYPPGYPPRY
jgi:hypothetical protein